jgi:hypothetical protein
MLETNTTTMEPTTRKTRTRKPSAPHIVALKAAVTNALKQEWLLQKVKQRLEKTIAADTAKCRGLTYEVREAWLTVQNRSADCLNANLE